VESLNASAHMWPMTTTTEQPSVNIIEPLATSESTCDRVRDLMKEDPEVAGKVVLTCDKPLGHDRRGPHRMRNAQGKTTCTWTGPADND
jgi:hypothetical protein